MPSAGGYYMVNSEGAEVREPENVVVLRARASAQAPDGMTVRDAVVFHALDLAHMPSDAEMDARRRHAWRETWWLWRKRPRARITAVPFSLRARPAPQVFAEVLGQQSDARPAARDGRRPRRLRAQPANSKAASGSRMLPDSFDVVDDPTQKEWRGRPLFGTYERGPRRRDAPSPSPGGKGRAEELPADAPAGAGYRGSNGRARLPGGYGAGDATSAISS